MAFRRNGRKQTRRMFDGLNFTRLVHNMHKFSAGDLRVYVQEIAPCEGMYLGQYRVNVYEGRRLIASTGFNRNGDSIFCLAFDTDDCGHYVVSKFRASSGLTRPERMHAIRGLGLTPRISGYRPGRVAR